MLSEMSQRKYTLRKRAEQQEETRSRIVDATMTLHEELGPARTTITAIAERAGVERLTVYRHFPDQDELFRACSSRFLELAPPPQPSQWDQIDDPGARVRKALEELYSYYSATAAMWTAVYRDLDDVAALAKVTAQFHDYLGEIRDGLVAFWKPVGRTRSILRGIIGHAIGFSTWKSLRSEGFSDRQIANLVLQWVEAITE